MTRRMAVRIFMFFFIYDFYTPDRAIINQLEWISLLKTGKRG
jgi:hypothetical protein